MNYLHSLIHRNTFQGIRTPVFSFLSLFFSSIRFFCIKSTDNFLFLSRSHARSNSFRDKPNTHTHIYIYTQNIISLSFSKLLSSVRIKRKLLNLFCHKDISLQCCPAFCFCPHCLFFFFILFLISLSVCCERSNSSSLSEQRKSLTTRTNTNLHVTEKNIIEGRKKSLIPIRQKTPDIDENNSTLFLTNICLTKMFILLKFHFHHD